MLLIDHQAGLFLGVKSIDQQILKNNAIALAKTAKVFDLPTVLFTSSAQGLNGPTIPEIKELFPDHKIHDRSPINLWNDPECRQAVEETNREKLNQINTWRNLCCFYFECRLRPSSNYSYSSSSDRRIFKRCRAK